MILQANGQATKLIEEASSRLPGYSNEKLRRRSLRLSKSSPSHARRPLRNMRACLLNLSER